MPANDFSTPLPELRLAELLSALSYALDMVEGQPPEHATSSAAKRRRRSHTPRGSMARLGVRRGRHCRAAHAVSGQYCRRNVAFKNYVGLCSGFVMTQGVLQRL